MSSTSYSSPLFEVPVLLHDDQIIVVNKPPGMLSVPGREILTTMKVRPRSEQWHSAIRSLLGEEDVHAGSKRRLSALDDSDQGNALRGIFSQLLAKNDNVPRKEGKFKAYLTRIIKVEDKSLQDLAFRAVVARDDQLHRIGLNSIPDHLLSASDVASHLASEYLLSRSSDSSSEGSVAASTPPQQQKVHHVHRLDMETSGLLMFAKDEHISAALDKQFRDHEVSVCLLPSLRLCTIP